MVLSYLTGSLPLGTPLGVELQQPHAVERDAGHRTGDQVSPARSRAVAEPHALTEPDLSRWLRIVALYVQAFHKLLRSSVGFDHDAAQVLATFVRGLLVDHKVPDSTRFGGDRDHVTRTRDPQPEALDLVGQRIGGGVNSASSQGLCQGQRLEQCPLGRVVGGYGWGGGCHVFSRIVGAYLYFRTHVLPHSGVVHILAYIVKNVNTMYTT